MSTTFVQTPGYKNFAESFLNGPAVLSQALLDSALLYHCSGGLSWPSIQNCGTEEKDISDSFSISMVYMNRGVAHTLGEAHPLSQQWWR